MKDDEPFWTPPKDPWKLEGFEDEAKRFLKYLKTVSVQNLEPHDLIQARRKPGLRKINKVMSSELKNWIALFETKKNREKQLVLEKLPYATKDLAPILSENNVDYHYNVLSRGYVERYNSGKGDPEFNYGGAKLHNLFWAQLQSPKGSNLPKGSIKEFIEKKYKDYDIFKEELLAAAMRLQGSGWVYLSKIGDIKLTPNQTYRSDILMPIDMWEHSFMDYVPAKDAKKKYILNILKIVNWNVINDRLNQ